MTDDFFIQKEIEYNRQLAERDARARAEAKKVQAERGKRAAEITKAYVEAFTPPEPVEIPDPRSDYELTRDAVRKMVGSPAEQAKLGQEERARHRAAVFAAQGLDVNGRPLPEKPDPDEPTWLANYLASGEDEDEEGGWADYSPEEEEYLRAQRPR